MHTTEHPGAWHRCPRCGEYFARDLHGEPCEDCT